VSRVLTCVLQSSRQNAVKKDQKGNECPERSSGVFADLKLNLDVLLHWRKLFAKKWKPSPSPRGSAREVQAITGSTVALSDSGSSVAVTMQRIRMNPVLSLVGELQLSESIAPQNKHGAAAVCSPRFGPQLLGSPRKNLCTNPQQPARLKSPLKKSSCTKIITLSYYPGPEHRSMIKPANDCNPTFDRQHKQSF